MYIDLTKTFFFLKLLGKFDLYLELLFDFTKKMKKDTYINKIKKNIFVYLLDINQTHCDDRNII